MSPRLVAVTGPFQGAAFAIDGLELSIGRDRANAICLDDLAVSRHHAIVRVEGPHVRISDLGSRNRTSVNGVPVSERVLNHGDHVRIGRSVFMVSLRGSDAPRPMLVDEEPPADQTVVLERKDARYLNAAGTVEACTRPGGARGALECLLGIGEAMAGRQGVGDRALAVLERAAQAIPAQRGAIVLGDLEIDRSREQSWHREGVALLPLRVPRSIVRRVLHDHVSILSVDVASDAEVGIAASVVASRATSLLAVPVVLGGRALAAIYLDTCNPAHPFDVEHLQLLTGIASMAADGLESAVRLDEVRDENARLKAESTLEHDLVGDSPRMQLVYSLIAKVSPVDSTVLIGGESGTGKELVARAIHRNSPRVSRPFIAINCATLGEALLESELFGHERGAFTGAVALKKGKLEEAQGGTLFLDEIGELAPGIQAKLLRVLQQREFERVGGTKMIKADVRVIAATNRDLRKEVQRGAFRQDLYFRLDVVSMTMPALRDRRDDIPALVRHFLEKHATRSSRRMTGCAPEAMACLQGYDWPGNVRELENTIERALVLGSASVILPEDLPDSILDAGDAVALAGPKFHQRLQQIKKQLLLDALEQAGHNYTEAAKLLGLHPNNLHRLMKNLGVRPTEP